MQDIASQVEKMLIGLLKQSGLTRGKIVLAVLMLDSWEPQLAMCEWLLDNPDATEEEILAEVRRHADAYERWKKQKNRH